MKSNFYCLMTAALIVTTSSCTNSSKKEISSVTDDSVETPTEISGSLEAYIALKNSLVDSDVNAAINAARWYEMALQDEEGDPEMIELAQAITSDEDLESQRTSFKTLSELLIETLRQSGSPQPVYVQYCPMAFDDNGANWISLSEDIENPYFGDEMLYCGSVEEEL